MAKSYVLSERDFRRVINVVRRVEAGTPAAGPDLGYDPVQAGDVFARVDDGTPDEDGYYEAQVVVYEGGDWEDYAIIRLLPLNDDDVLVEGLRYRAAPIGSFADEDDEPDLYVVTGTASTTAINCVEVLVDVSIACVDDALVVTKTYQSLTGYFTLSEDPCPEE